MLLPTMTPWLAVGLVLVVGITLFGVLGPYLVGDPTQIRDQGLTPPSAEFPLGTTQTGQDVLAQLAYATRGSLQIGFLVGVLATALSAFFGIYGAYRGGFADEAFSLLSNVFLVIPGLPHHVTQRGNGRGQTFFEEADYALYRDLFAEAASGRGARSGPIA